MKHRSAGAVAAALVVGAVAVWPAQAAKSPLPPAPVAGPDVHQFVFTNGQSLYHGPLDERLGIDAPAAYAAAVERSLRRLGVPERTLTAGSHGGPDTVVYKGHDWDGDAKADTLAIEWSAAGTAVVGRKGLDGTPLWRWETTSDYAFAQAALVGDGQPGALVWEYGGVDGGVAAVPRVTITALGGDGAVLWEQTHRGVWAAGAARNLPLVTGVGRLTSSSADDVVLSRSTFVSAVDGGRTRTTTEVIDGRDGAMAHSTQSGWSADDLTPVPAGDVTGDGLDDVLLVGDTTLAAMRGADGQSLWQADGLPVHHRAPAFVGDVTGDGRVDLAVASTLWEAETFYERDSVVVNGATGAVASNVRGTLPTGAGDVDGDGIDDVGTVEASYDGTVGAVTYRTFRGDGRPLGEQSFSQAEEWDTTTYIYLWQVGDVQRDGAVDWAHAINSYDEDGLRRSERGVVSGRTGLRLWAGKPGLRLGGAVDGDGEDLVLVGPGGVQAQDGMTGRELWTAPTERYEAEQAWSVGDVDGDGRDEVAIALYGPSTDFALRTRVVSGLDGRLLWGPGSAVVQPPQPPVAVPEQTD